MQQAAAMGVTAKTDEKPPRNWKSVTLGNAAPTPDAAGLAPAENHRLPKPLAIPHRMPPGSSRWRFTFRLAPECSTAIPFFTAGNVATAYQLRCHFAWRTHGRQPLLKTALIQATMRDPLQQVAEQNEYHLLEADVENDAVFALVSLRPEHNPSQVTRVIKGNLAAEARKRFGIHNLWSRGVFVRSVGAVTNETVRNNVARQIERHRAAPAGDAGIAPRAGFHSGQAPSQLRTSDHAAFEYNLHVVLVTRRRFEFLDQVVSRRLVEYWLRVCEKKQWAAWDVEVVSDHAHLFLGARPSDSPQEVALGLMNNAAYFLHQHDGAGLKSEELAAC